MRRAVVIYNPIAGTSRGRRIAERARARLQSHGFAVDLVATRDRGGATQVARDVAEEVDLLVVAGGDGSLREALDGLGEARGRIVLAFLPIGNANVAAQELGIPTDPVEALDLLSEGVPTQIDLGRVHLDGRSRLFLAVVGVGWDAITVRYMDRVRRSSLGRRCYRTWADGVYVVCGLLATLHFRPARFRVIASGEELEGTYCAAHFCNFRAYGKGMSMAPEAHYQSGRLHYQLRKISWLPGLVWHLIAAQLRRRAPWWISRYGEGQRLEMRSNVPVPVQIDGDSVGECARLAVEILPAAARILVSKEQRALAQ